MGVFKPVSGEKIDAAFARRIQAPTYQADHNEHLLPFWKSEAVCAVAL